MTDLFWTVVLGAGAIQALFLGSVLLFGRNGNRQLGLLVATLLVIFAVGIFAQVVQDSVPPKFALLIAFLNINTELTFGPVYYLIVRSLVLPDRRLRASDLMHLLPFLLGLATWATAWFGVDDHQQLFSFGFDSAFPVLEFMAFKALVLYSYIVASCRLLYRTSRDGGKLYAGRHRVDPMILLRVTIVLAVIPTVIYVIAAIDHSGVAANLNSDQIAGLLLVGVIFAAAWLLMFRPWVLALKAGDTESGRWKRDASHLAAYLDREKPWLDPDLKSADVARTMNWTESTLSSVIKRGMNTTFQGLLNSYRLAEFERLARNTESRPGDVLALALEAGFGSKAAFYRVFREAHDVTPAQYRSALAKSLPAEASQLSK